MRFTILMVALAGVGPAAAFAQADTTKRTQPATKTAAPAPTQQKTATPPATQQKTATAPTTQQKTATPPATQQKTAAPQTTPTTQQKTAPAPTTQQKTATPPTTQQKTATAPATQQKTAAPQTTPTTQQKTATPPATQQKSATAPATQQKTAAPPPTTQQKTAAPAPQTKAPAPQTKTPPAGTTGAGVRAGTAAAGRGSIPTAQQDTAIPMVMMREVFEYNREGRRDPFISLLSTTDLRPTLSDLKLLMTVVDEPGRSVALVQDGYERKQKTLRVGTRLGRMRVSSIRSDVVVFTIEEFGMNRRDSLLLRDSTKVRGR